MTLCPPRLSPVTCLVLLNDADIDNHALAVTMDQTLMTMLPLTQESEFRQVDMRRLRASLVALFDAIDGPDSRLSLHAPTGPSLAAQRQLVTGLVALRKHVLGTAWNAAVLCDEDEHDPTSTFGRSFYSALRQAIDGAVCYRLSMVSHCMACGKGLYPHHNM